MAQMHGYELLLWALGVVLPLIVVARIWQAGLLSEYRALVRYNLVCAASLPILVVTYAYYPPPNSGFCLYCLVWWSVVIATDACALAVLLSIFREIFKPYEALKQLGNVMFRWTLGVLVVVALVSALSAGAPRYIDKVNHTLLMFDRGLQILQCGVVLFLLLSWKFLGISFRHRVFGIAVGFGLYASVSLLAVSVSTWAPASVTSIVGAIANSAAMIGYGIWLVYFYVPQPERRFSDAQPESRRWEYALASIQMPAPEGMFLTSIDRTVERLLTKNNVATQAKPKEDKHWFGD
ncbi:hypothetical protein Acid345_3901 [Candidatus Koribacter versatilis Ellin345]|uniref:Transmembrane protein n=1 Tax=Koribacter versatilis (strain Ellin345) TaxID=204669 RepID=Q1IJP9_KORVE|nr:hypothetical protein [Candidatus Koribacter versatilis]ABF42901.1 hypothetical protein Acid345_3901 [Candidatus Koribacter versatilis Ellin345]